MALPTDALVVFALIAGALVLFVTERVPSDVVAIGVLVSLAALEPWTGVDAATALTGFASPATVTIIAMYILSAGVQETGVVTRLGHWLSRATGGDERRLLAATVGTTGLSAGFVNNTPVVAVFIPMIQGIADRAGLSPSKLLLPLSYAAMLGGTLTLVGTSTNLLVSDLSRRLLDHPLSMFEFTPLGLVVLVVGIAYLLTVGRWLTPERVEPKRDLTTTYEVHDHLARLRVRAESPLVGERAREVFADEERDVDLLQVRRGPEAFLAAGSDTRLEPRDTLVVRYAEGVLEAVAEAYDLKHLTAAPVDEADLAERGDRGTVVEAVVPPDSAFRGRTLADIRLPNRYDTRVLAIRHGGDLVSDDLPNRSLAAGDALLLQTTTFGIEHLRERGDLVFTEAIDESLVADADRTDRLSPLTPVALGILGGVIGLAALDVLPLVIAALGGVVAMVVTGCLRPREAYDAVSWEVVFLLAGLLPLGVALQQTGGAAIVAGLLVGVGTAVGAVVLLGLVYLLTGLVANLITPVASVVLLVPVAVDTARAVGAEPFSFVLAVLFAASSAFMTPIGYQTNLMVYGPGGYRFTDYVRVGAPLQLLLTVVVTVGIWAMWGV